MLYSFLKSADPNMINRKTIQNVRRVHRMSGAVQLSINIMNIHNKRQTIIHISFYGRTYKYMK